MNTKDKPTITFFALAIIIFVVISLLVAFFFLKQKEARFEAEEKVEQLLKLKEETENNLKKLTLAKTVVETELKETNEKLSILINNLQEEKNLKLSALDKLEQKNKEIKDLSIRLKEKEEKLSNLEKELLEAKNRISYLKTKIEQLQEEKKKLEEKLNIIRLEEIVIRPKKEFECKILVINNEYGFIIIDIGEKNDISSEGRLSLYRQEKKIAEVEIIEVIENMASALIISGNLEDLEEKTKIKLIEEADIE